MRFRRRYYRPSMMMVWTFGSLALVSLFVGVPSVMWLLYQAKQTYIDMQVSLNVQQADRIARVLEQELGTGQPPDQVARRLQESLVNAPYDEAGYLCLMGKAGKVICHPDPEVVGTTMDEELSPVFQKDTFFIYRIENRVKGVGFARNQSRSGKVHLVYERPVKGSPWSVAVHSNMDLIDTRLLSFRKKIIQLMIPTFLGFILLATLVVRMVEGRGERLIDAANASLELRIIEHTRELKEAKKLYHSLFENAPGAIFLCRADGMIIHANSRAEEITRYSRDELSSKSFLGLCQKEAVLPGGTAVLKTGRAWQGVLKTEKADNRIVHVYENEVLESDQTLTQYIVLDVTEQKQLEAQFLQAQKMESVGRLAGGVAHDFNNLLTIINGYSEFLLKSLSVESPLHRQAAEICKAGESAVKLTRQLLSFSRRQIIEPRIVNLNDLILNMEKMLLRLAGEDIELQTKLEDNLGFVRIDPGQAEQVLANLVVNARDAMPSGGRLTLETANVNARPTALQDSSTVPAGSFVSLRVSDTGVGMTDEVKAHLFEPFFTTKEKGKGTGLGLATCYGIIRQSGGTIEVQSEPGKGTTFLINLPRMDERPGQFPHLENRYDLPRGIETVLLVEDEPAVRNLTVQMLRECGYEVIEAGNGEEAVEIVRNGMKKKFQLLITDVIMPRKGGKALADEITALLPDRKMKILFISGYTDDVIAHHGVLDPGIEFLHKPFSTAALAVKVRQVLDQ